MDDRSRRIRVLHVDDDDQRTRVTKRVLEDVRERFDVVTETSASDGLARLEETNVDCVVSDYAMPRTNGLEFLEAVREEAPDLPFILFTGKGSEEIASDAISAGVTDYLQKSGGMETYAILANRIENAVAKRDAETEARQVYRAMEAAEEGIGLLDEDGRFTYVNGAYADMYGYDADELVGEHWSVLYPEGQVERVRDDILPAVEENETWRGETTGLRRDGSTFVEDHTLATRKDGGLVCAVRDATKREADRGDRASLTTDVLDTSDVGTVVISADSDIVWLNEAVEEYFGLDRSELLGADHRSVIDDYLSAVLASPERFAERAMADGGSRFEFRTRETERTDERWLERWSKPIESGPYAGGRVVHHKDVTERKRHETRLDQRRRELRHQTERLEEFADVLRNDVQRSLGTAQRSASLLWANSDADEDAVEEIDRTLDRIETVVDDVLTLSSEGRLVEDASPVDLSTVAREAWGDDITLQTDATLRIDADATVVAEEARLKRLFDVLFRNAVEHGSTSNRPPDDDAVEHAESAPTVEVGRLSDGFYVADDGPGISEETREAAFESAVATDGEGPLFDLSVVRQIALGHGWEISVTESSTGGARIEFENVDVVDAVDGE